VAKEVVMVEKGPCELESLLGIADQDAKEVYKKNQEYGDSWCKRGGEQAFAVIWRKVDRIDSIALKNGYDIFKLWEENPSDIRDDIRDLRRYLLLLEEYQIRMPQSRAS
jgi:hypothetical protein